MSRFRGHVSDLNLKRKKNDRRLDKKFDDIDTRNSKRRQSLSFQQELQRTLTNMREKDSALNQAHNKAVLDCIKERIWRKHKKVQARRMRQQ